MEGAKDIVKTDRPSFDDVFPFNRRESVGSTVGDDDPILDCSIVLGKFDKNFTGFCTTWICGLSSCRFPVIPGHILLENSNSFVGELSKFVILSINVFVISGDTDLSSSYCKLFKDN